TLPQRERDETGVVEAGAGLEPAPVLGPDGGDLATMAAAERRRAGAFELPIDPPVQNQHRRGEDCEHHGDPDRPDEPCDDIEVNGPDVDEATVGEGPYGLLAELEGGRLPMLGGLEKSGQD